MTKARGAPSEGLTFKAFWHRFVRIVDPNTGRIVKPVPLPKQQELIDAADSGIPEIFAHRSKKTSKTFDGSAWNLWHFVADPWHRGERLGAIASHDEEQSLIVLRSAANIVDLDPWLSTVVKRYKTELVYREQRRDPHTGGRFTLDHRLRALSRDELGGHGQRYTHIHRDEHWTETDHRFSESLIITPLCSSGQILYTSYFAPSIMLRPGVPFYDLLERAKNGDPGLFYQYVGGTGADAASRHFPWITEAWIERQRKILESSPSRFNRVILNIPGGIDGGLITTAELHAALAPIREPAAVTDRCWAAVDLGVRFDWTAVLIGHVDNEAKLVVDVIRTWRPTPDKAVSLLDVTDELRSLYRRFPWTDLRLDQSQSRLIAEMLQRDSIPCRVVEISAADQNRLVTGLKAAFARRLIRIPDNALDLIEQLESVRAIESRRGLLKLREGDASRVGTDARAHDDLAFALALLVDMAGSELGRLGLPEMTSCYRAESLDRYVPCYLWTEGPGSYVPSGCPSCKACPAHQAVLAGWRRDGREMDLRTYRKTCCGDNTLIKQRRETAAWRLIGDWAESMGL